MKKRILSMILVLTFVLCAIPMSLSAAEVDGANAVSDWTAKVGTISELGDSGIGFQIDAGTGPRQAMYTKYLKSGKISVTFDIASIFAKRAPTASNPGTGSNDTAIIFGGSGINESALTTVNAIETASQYYCLMFTNDDLYIAKVDKFNIDATTGNIKPWAGAVGARAKLTTVLGDTWSAIKDSGTVTATVEFTEAGAVKVWINDNLIEVLTKAEGECVPYGAEVGVRVGMGYHVPTQISNWEITGEISDTDPYAVPDTPNDPITDPDDNKDPVTNPDDNKDPVTDPDDNKDPVTDPDDNKDPVPTPNPVTPEDDKEDDSNSSAWIIIAVVAAVVVIGIVVGVVVAKKKKA